MEKERAPRNKTLTISDKERALFEKKNIVATSPLSANEIIDKTYNGDLLESIKYFPSESVDLIVIDPPYNLSKNFHGVKFESRDDEKYFDYLESWLPQVLRLLKPIGSAYICCDWKSTAAVYQVMEKYLKVKSRITWQREKGRGSKNNWKNCIEDIWFGTKSNDYFFDVDAVKMKRKVIAPYKVDGKPKDWEETEDGNFRITYPSNFWDDISIPYWSMSENTDHPTQKPEKLIAKLILASCPVGGLVFDPFLGSGTTSVVAKKLQRHYCGIELNTEYCNWIQKRLDMAESNNSIQGYSGGVFWERNSLKSQKTESKRKDSAIASSLFEDNSEE